MKRIRSEPPHPIEQNQEFNLAARLLHLGLPLVVVIIVLSILIMLVSRAYWVAGASLLVIIALLHIWSTNSLRQAIQHAQRSEERYRNLVEHSSEGIWLLAFDEPIPLDLPPAEQVRRIQYTGYVAECNSVLAKMYGFNSREELLGQRLLDLYGGQPAERNTQSTLRLVESGYVSADRETQEVNSRGEKVYFLNNAVGVIENGQLLALWGTQRDISEIKHVEAALRSSLARQEALLKAIPDMIFEVSRNGDFLYFAPAHDFEPLLPPAQFIGRNISQLLPDEVSRPAMQAIEQAFQSGQMQTFEYTLEINGMPGHYEARVAISSDDTALCIVRDISRREQAETQIRQYADIVQNMQVGMYLIRADDLNDDRSLRVIAANPAALHYSEKTAEEVIGKTMDEIFLTLRAKGFPQKYLQVLKTGLPAELEDLYYDEQGSLDDAFSIKVFRLSEDTIGVLFENVLERKLSEERLRRFNAELERRVDERAGQLEAANKALESFTYSVSHDLRAPLRGIDGYSMLLLEDYQGFLDHTGQGYLQRMRQATRQMNGMIDALLNLSRISRASLDLQAVDLSHIAQATLAYFAEMEPQRKVDVQVEPGLIARCDQRLMQIALQNLIENAWKYTAKQPQARIEFGQRLVNDCTGASEVVYYVADNGAGFDMAYADRLFGAFQRLHSAEEYPGNGIGLATVQRIISRHGGRIWGQAIVGQGATFYFTLEE